MFALFYSIQMFWSNEELFLTNQKIYNTGSFLRISLWFHDMLKLNLQQPYGMLLVGKSLCHEFTKVSGHTGGFCHTVCPHGESNLILPSNITDYWEQTSNCYCT